jgi:hypothetical protein
MNPSAPPDLSEREERLVERYRSLARRLGGDCVTFPRAVERKANSLCICIDNMRDVDMAALCSAMAPARLFIKSCPRDSSVASRLACYVPTRPTAHLAALRALAAATAAGIAAALATCLLGRI